VWDVESGVVNDYPHLVKDQSVISLTAWKGLIVGGTTTGGGVAATPPEGRKHLHLGPEAARKAV